MLKQRQNNLYAKQNRAGILYMLPSLLVLAAVLFIPLVISLLLGFTKWNYLQPGSAPVFNGIENYKSIFSKSYDLHSIKVTLTFVVFAVFFEVLFGLLLALLFNQKLPKINLLRTFVILPMMISEVVSALCFRYLLHSDFGIVNYFLGLFNISVNSWVGAKTALFTIIMVDVWQNTPFCMIIILAGLQSIPQDTLEAGHVDGANGLQLFRSIIFPAITPQILIAMIFRTTFTLRVFTQPWVLTGGGPSDLTTVLGINIYRKAFRYFELGEANAMAWLLIIISLLFISIYIVMMDKENSIQ